MAITEDDLDRISLLVKICCAISFCGSMFVLSTILYFRYIVQEPKMNKFAYHLVSMVVINDIFFEIAVWLTGPGSSGFECTFSGMLQQFGSMGSILWIFLMSYTIYDAVTNDFPKVEKNIWMWHGIIWGITLILALLPLTTDSYGQAGGWCWVIDEDPIHTAMRYIIFYGPLWVILISIIWMYYKILQQVGFDSPIMKRAGIYPIILVCAWTFGTINRITNTAGEQVPFLIYGQAFFMGMYGFMNFLAYIMTPGVRHVVFGCVQEDIKSATYITEDSDSETSGVEMVSGDEISLTPKILPENGGGESPDL